MNKEIFQQEILLMTSTTFLKRELCENGKNDNNNPLSENEKLAQACWSGLLDELLPEIITDKKLHIWKIWDRGFFLQIERSEYRSEDDRFSINPYYFLGTIEHN